jgi:[CysO sulfur-carrier protein]-S-L-cysteine hydrolase
VRSRDRSVAHGEDRAAVEWVMQMTGPERASCLRPGVDVTVDRPITLVLPPELQDQIISHLRSMAPLEGVGLLAIEQLSSAPHRIGTCYYPGTNQDCSPTRYTMAPEEVLRSFLDMEQRGWILGGIVHSHPLGPATPSPTDMREFRYPEALMVIVSLAGDAPDLRAWWLGDRSASWPAEVPVCNESDPRS